MFLPCCKTRRTHSATQHTSYFGSGRLGDYCDEPEAKFAAYFCLQIANRSLLCAENTNHIFAVNTDQSSETVPCSEHKAHNFTKKYHIHGFQDLGTCDLSIFSFVGDPSDRSQRLVRDSP